MKIGGKEEIMEIMEIGEIRGTQRTSQILWENPAFFNYRFTLFFERKPNDTKLIRMDFKL